MTFLPALFRRYLITSFHLILLLFSRNLKPNFVNQLGTEYNQNQPCKNFQATKENTVDTHVSTYLYSWFCNNAIYKYAFEIRFSFSLFNKFLIIRSLQIKTDGVFKYCKCILNTVQYYFKNCLSNVDSKQALMNGAFITNSDANTSRYQQLCIPPAYQRVTNNSLIY